MTNLKTLKDIEHRIWTNEDDNVFINNQIRNNLKQEAIKWVKQPDYLRIDSINHSKCPKCGGKLEYTYEQTYDCNECNEIWEVWQLFFIEFFNILGEEI